MSYPPHLRTGLDTAIPIAGRWAGRTCVSAGPYPSRLPRGARDAEIVGADRPRQAAVRRDYKAAQRLTRKPVKFGTMRPSCWRMVRTRITRIRGRIFAFGGALNEELHELADAGCPAIQFEEPQVHLFPARGKS